MDLLASEIRVLGCLLEKQRTTPDHYPLTLNSLRLACNQSTNREPVVEYDEATIRDALHRLERRGMARFAGGVGSRAAKFRHLLAEALPMDGGEQAVMCVLMLRGPQTPGELKQRGERLHPFAALEDVHETLRRLTARELVVRLQRRRGQKEERYAHTLAGEQESAAGAPLASTQASIQPASEPAASTVAPGVRSGGAGIAAAPAGQSHANGANGNMGSGVLAEREAEELSRLREQVSTLEAEVRRLRRDVQGLQAELGVETSPAVERDLGAQAPP